MAEKKSRWIFWVLGGCLFIAIAGVAAVVGVIYWGKNKVETFVEEQTDPSLRDQKVKEILGATALPAGYYPGTNLSIGIAKTARLTDTPPTAEGSTEFRERGFIYNEAYSDGKWDIEPFLNGAAGNSFEEMGTRLRADETIAGGTMTVNDQNLHWYARRGEVTDAGDSVAGLFTVVTVRCPQERERWAVWFQRVDPSVATGDVPREGSVIDENAIRAFFGHFRICGS